MKTTLAMVVVIGCAAFAYADNLPTNGLDNQILYWNGTATTGSNATWGDPTSIPGLQGPVGPQGVAGIDGTNGTNGVDGANGTNGTNGVDGKDGATGPAGATGAKGVTGSKGDTGKQGLQGAPGHNAEAPAIDPRIDVEIREYDAEHWSVSSFASFGMQSATSRYIVGQKLTLKIGDSYETRRIKALEKKMEKLSHALDALEQ